MWGLDTNVLVRLLIEDCTRRRLGGREKGWVIRPLPGREETVLVSLPVLLETEWVLRSRYEYHQKNDSASVLCGSV